MFMSVTSADLLKFPCAAKLKSFTAQGDDASVSLVLSDTNQLEFRRGESLDRDIYDGMLA